MWSRRLSWESPQNALSRALEARRFAKLPIIDLTESNPTQVGLPRAEVPLPDAPLYEPQPKGLRAAREAVARYYADAGAAVDPERIVLTASTSEAYSLLFKLLCDPGDQVLVPEPSYPLFSLLTALDSVEPAPYPVRWDGEWHLDAESLRTALDAAPRAKALLFVNPGNPTGAFLKRDEWSFICELCAARGVAFISDEVFNDFAHGDDARRVRTVAGDPPVLSFALSGLSKVAGLPQLKLGWCAVGGPAAQADAAVARLELIADTYLSLGAPVQHGAQALLDSRHAFQAALRARLATNLKVLRAARGASASWDVLPGEGGWSAIIAVPRARSEEAHALRLLERGVLVHPGYFFDFPAGAYLVLSLLPREDDFARAAKTLAEALSD